MEIKVNDEIIEFIFNINENKPKSIFIKNNKNIEDTLINEEIVNIQKFLLLSNLNETEINIEELGKIKSAELKKFIEVIFEAIKEEIH